MSAAADLPTAAGAPDPLLLPRLMQVGPDAGADLRAHLGRHGRLSLDMARERLLAEVARSGLTGRGGAGFPAARKLAAVAERSGGRAVVVGNGAEGEPASGKDHVLLSSAPHLVLDGLAVAAYAVRARTAYLYVLDDRGALAVLRAALAQRARAGMDRVTVQLVTAPTAFLSGEESAVVSALSGRPALPYSTPPRVFERGVGGRPTLVHNVETLAQLGLLARWGAEWFAAIGDPEQPGSRLYTVWDGPRARVVEAASGSTARELLAAIGGRPEQVQALLVGGYHGSWLPVAALDAPLSDPALRRYGASAGAGVLLALPHGVCGLREAARVSAYLSAESAQQCGPCLNGLPLIADGMRRLAAPGRAEGVRRRVEHWAGLVEGRGACKHPDGSVRFVRSALQVFGPELDLHARGRCSASTAEPMLPCDVEPATARGRG